MLCVSVRSEVAILYNDRSVLENHHVSAAYRLMAEEDMNILVNLNKDDWRCSYSSLIGGYVRALRADDDRCVCWLLAGS